VCGLVLSHFFFINETPEGEEDKFSKLVRIARVSFSPPPPLFFFFFFFFQGVAGGRSKP